MRIVLDLSRIVALIFDLDGVLIDSEELNIAAARAGFAAVGFPLAEDDVVSIVGRHPADYVPELMRRHQVPEAAFSKLRRVQEATYLERHASVSPVPGAVAVLTGLHERGFRLAVATSSERTNTEQVLERIGVRSRLEFVLTRDDVPRRKPAPDVYLLASDRFSLPPEGILVVEDSSHGIEAARAAGLACVALRSPHLSSEAAAAADHTVNSFDELKDLLDLPA
ncbi:MAG: HAD-IA family hydrolase [Candidatus Eisenbacteria bacterium]|nr:HAD-IA family hydrolase [Candidatus Eisenbacteria bacterium]